MKNFVTIITVAVIAAALGAAAAWFLRPSQDEQLAQIQPDQTPDQAPAFQLKDLDGNTRKSSEWAGRTVVLNFWATWCAPCRREIPILTELQAAHDPAELTVLGIAIDEADAVREYVEQIGMGYETLVGQLDAIEVVGQYGNRIGALPYTVIINPDNNIRWIHAGEVTREMLADAITASPESLP